MAQAKVAYRSKVMEAAQEIGKIGAGNDPYHDCSVAGCSVKHVFAHEVTFCQHCKKETCYPHRFQDQHACTARSKPTAAPAPSPSPRPQEAPCKKPGCKIKIGPDHRTGDACPKCKLVFCWTHQKDFNHDCKPPQSLLLQKQKSNPMDTFRSIFKSKNEARGKTTGSTAPKASASKPSSGSSTVGTKSNPIDLTKRLSSFRKTATTYSATASTTSTENLKGNTLPKDRRTLVYIQAEAPPSSTGPETSTTKISSIKAYFDSAKNVGQILDIACGYLAIHNNNNRDPDPNNWWSFYNLNRANDPIPENGMKFGEFARDGDQLILMKGLAAVKVQT